MNKSKVTGSRQEGSDRKRKQQHNDDKQEKEKKKVRQNYYHPRECQSPNKSKKKNAEFHIKFWTEKVIRESAKENVIIMITNSKQKKNKEIEIKKTIN